MIWCLTVAAYSKKLQTGGSVCVCANSYAENVNFESLLLASPWKISSKAQGG
jgi:hypothetical protein